VRAASWDVTDLLNRLNCAAVTDPSPSSASSAVSLDLAALSLRGVRCAVLSPPDRLLLLLGRRFVLASLRELRLASG
jgi:hypothetical protein